MVEQRARQAGVLAGLVLVLAACGAALFAHVGIDLAGDYVLAHDTYDGLDHHSRGEIAGLGMCAALAAGLRIVCLAFKEARTGGRIAMLSFEEIFGQAPLRFVGMVVLMTVPALMSMEWLDVAASGGHIEDLTDLLGGSAPLALTIALPCAALVAFAVRRLARLIMKTHRALVAVIRRIMVLLSRWPTRQRERAECRETHRSMQRRSILSRRWGKRGPPLHAS